MDRHLDRNVANQRIVDFDTVGTTQSLRVAPRSAVENQSRPPSRRRWWRMVLRAEESWEIPGSVFMAETLYQIYLQTAYEIYALRTSLMIGQKNEVVDAFLQRHAADRFAFLTAWNPQSRLLSESANRARNQRLAADLVGWPYLLGTTRGPDPSWPGEESFFVVGMSREQGVKIALRYEQNALICGQVGKAAELVFTNEAARLRCTQPLRT